MNRRILSIKNYITINPSMTLTQLWIMGLIVLAIVAWADYITGWELAFPTFYYIPVILVARSGRTREGVAMAVVCAVTCYWVDIATGSPYSTEFVRYWNTSIRLVAYLIVAVLILQVRWLFDKEKIAKDALGVSQQRLLAETAARAATLEQLRHAERLETVGRLASGVAHELGTPLNVVSGRAGFILSGRLSETQIQENAAVIKNQAERMSAIIRKLLDFARPHIPHKVRSDLREAVEQTLDLMRPLAKKEDVALVPVLSATPVLAKVDVAQIQQVLMNLILNAVQATPQGRKVTVTADRVLARPPESDENAESPYTRLVVTDEGEGIRKEHLTRLFEPFFTTKEVGEGTGLGLSIAYGIVSEHGGWLDVASQDGKGSAFSVYLPAEE